MSQNQQQKRRRSSLATCISDVQTEFNHLRFALATSSSKELNKKKNGGDENLEPQSNQDVRSWCLSPMNRDDYKAIPLSKPPDNHTELDSSLKTQELNLYTNILPYNHNRVALQDSTDITSSYVNASYVRSPDGNSKAYIAAMSPTVSTVKAFWRMIWQEHVTCVVMLCDLKEDGQNLCAQYWGPNVGNKIKVAKMLVTTVRVVNDQRKDMVRSVLEVQHPSGEQRIIHHFWYRGWVSVYFIFSL